MCRRTGERADGRTDGRMDGRGGGRADGRPDGRGNQTEENQIEEQNYFPNSNAPKNKFPSSQ